MLNSMDGPIICGLVVHASSILPITPCALHKVAEVLVAKGVAPSSSEATHKMLELASAMPSTFIIENERTAGQFLIFYHVEALRIITHQARTGTEDVAQSLELSNKAVENDFSTVIAHLSNESHSAVEDLRRAISELTNAPTAMELQSLEDLKKTFAKIPVLEICSSDYSKCKRSRKKDCASKIHFEKVLAPHSDPTLGDCSYLDTCFKGKQCKYVHYQIRYPKAIPRAVSNPISCTPAQYINANLLELDLGLLGNDYRAMIIDPPWDIHTNPGSHGGCSDQDVLALSVDKLQHDGVVFLWVTGRVLDLGRQCLAKWGYEHVEELVWLKTNQLGRSICTGRTGHWLNHTKEHVLVGAKGKLISNGIKVLDSDVIVSNALGKSQKPEELYGIIDRLVGVNSKKLELFGRRSNIRPGWLTVGNEMGSTRILDAQLKSRLHCGK